MGHTCIHCMKVFPTPSKLRAHQSRKYPCTITKEFTCVRCERTYLSQSALIVHMKKCTISTVQSELYADLVSKIHDMNLMIHKLVSERDGESSSTKAVTNIGTANFNNVNSNTINIILPFSGKGIIQISSDTMERLRLNPLFEDYCTLSAVDQTSMTTKGVTLFASIAAQALAEHHKNPEARNIRLDRTRADRYEINDGNGKWKTADAVETCTSIAKQTGSELKQHAVQYHAAQQHMEAVGGLYSIFAILEENTADIAKCTKKSVDIHLKNME